MTTFTPQEEKVYQVLSEILVNDFEIPADKIKPEARLYEDFDIDSIDAVDMIVQLKPHPPHFPGSLQAGAHTGRRRNGHRARP